MSLDTLRDAQEQLISERDRESAEHLHTQPPHVEPCPFCGDTDPAVDEVEVRVWALVCNECGCIGPIENYESADQSAERAIELWNRRGNT